MAMPDRGAGCRKSRRKYIHLELYMNLAIYNAHIEIKYNTVYDEY